MKKTANTHVFDSLEAILASETQNSPLCFRSQECLTYLANNFRKK